MTVRSLRSPLALAGLQDRHPVWLAGSVMMLALIVAVLIWSRFAILEEVTTGSAQIVPSGKVQVIQSLEGGIVSALNVHEGDLVEAGQALIVIDPTRAEASFQESNKRRLSLIAAAARLRAEASAQPLAFPPEVAKDAELVRYETDTYRVRRQAVDQAVAGYAGSIAILRRELAITAPMSERGLVPEVDVLRLRRQINDAQMQISERTNRYRADAGTELAKVEGELSQVSEVATGRRDALERTVLPGREHRAGAPFSPRAGPWRGHRECRAPAHRVVSGWRESLAPRSQRERRSPTWTFPTTGRGIQG